MQRLRRPTPTRLKAPLAVTDRDVVAFGWVLVAFFLLLAVLIGALDRCRDDDSQFVPVPADTPRTMEREGSQPDGCSGLEVATPLPGNRPVEFRYL